MNTFRDALKRQIRKTIREVRQTGTMKMSVDNLCQITRPPSDKLPGAPARPLDYAILFVDVCREPGIAPFILKEGK